MNGNLEYNKSLNYILMLSGKCLKINLKNRKACHFYKNINNKLLIYKFNLMIRTNFFFNFKKNVPILDIKYICHSSARTGSIDLVITQEYNHKIIFNYLMILIAIYI